MSTPSAPAAPGRLGVPIGSQELNVYLGALDAWVDATHTQIDRLDDATRAAGNAQDHSNDIVLALTLWQAIRSRTDEIMTVWDSGRADEIDRERIARLIWGRLESGAGEALVSLVEASTLCDAVVARLRSRLALDPQGTDSADRLRAVRAAVVRCEDLPGGDAALAERVSVLRAKAETLSAQAARGGDISGPLGELEVETARVERDAIVGAATRRETVHASQRAATELAAVKSREPTLTTLAARCRREIAAPPVLAVPVVARLGEVPDHRDDLEAFLVRLTNVRRAQDAVEEAYAAPLRERAELRYRMTGLLDQARGNGRFASPTVRSGYQEATEAVQTTPCDLVLARFLVEQFAYLARGLPREGIAR